MLDDTRRGGTEADAGLGGKGGREGGKEGREKKGQRDTHFNQKGRKGGREEGPSFLP